MNHSNKPDNVSTSVVSDVMSTSLVTMSSKSSMYDVAKKMSECRVSSIFLTIDGKATISDSNSWSESKIVGLVTQTDLVEKVCAKDKLASGITVETVMSPVIAISEDAKVEEATQMMIEKRIRHLAVREKNDVNRILGIITGTDLAKYLRQKLVNNQKESQYLGEELSIVDALSIPEAIPFGNQDEQ